VLVSEALAGGAAAEKVPLGKLGGTRPATERYPDPLLAVSDHCPVESEACALIGSGGV
jgi:hypothetical protein